MYVGVYVHVNKTKKSEIGHEIVPNRLSAVHGNCAGLPLGPYSFGYLLNELVHVHEPVGSALVGEVSAHGHHDIIVFIVLRLPFDLGYEVVHLWERENWQYEIAYSDFL